MENIMKTMLKNVLRNKISSRVRNILNPIYFDYIPIGEIDEALQDAGVVMLQDDNTEWAGIFISDEGNVFIRLASMDSANDSKNIAIPFYTPYENAGLFISWYKMTSGKIEITGYIS